MQAPSLLAIASVGLVLRTPTDASDALPLDGVAKAIGTYFNVSLSLAFTLNDGRTFASASGFEDHLAGGKLLTARSVIPGGSITKFFTSTAAMRLAEQGKLQLDEPVHKAVDQWLKSQGGSKSLLELWGGDERINMVTARQLLSMRAGIPDYDDAKLRDWTVANPDKDFLPDDFIHTVPKSFLFPPGHGGAYSGVGYVLMGWVLCAATRCQSWSDLDQRTLVESATFRLQETTFATTGPCSRYKGVVHQYLYYPARDRLALESVEEAPPTSTRPSPVLLDSDGGVLLGGGSGATGGRSLGSEAPQPAHCSGTPSKQMYWPDTALVGTTPMASRKVSAGGARACCTLGDGHPGAMFWTFIGDHGAASDSGTCEFYGMGVSGGRRQSNATSGRADPQLMASSFVDLYGASCLNGWTMGNVATTPSDLSRLYQAVFTGEVLSADSVAQMTAFRKLTQGFSPGAAYGLGLFSFPIQMPLKDVKSCHGYDAACKCGLFSGCKLELTMVGHPGQDYGSSYPLVGHFPELNASFAMAVTTGETAMGMNQTMGALENMAVQQALVCPFLQVLAKAAMPGFPSFPC